MKQTKLSSPAEKEREAENEATDTRSVCRYGADCYRKNPDHQKQYKHPRESRDSTPPPLSRKKVRLEDNTEADEFIDAASEDIDLVIKQAESATEDRTTTCSDTPDTTSKKVCIKYEQVLPSDNSSAVVKKRFFIELSDNCLQFWEFCLEKNKDSPCSALKELGMQLVGPFQVLAAIHKGTPTSEITHNCMEHRYYFDTPEVLTAIQVDETKGSHIGYYTDIPMTQPNFIVLCPNKENCVMKPIGDNLFQAVLHLHEDTGGVLVKSLKEFAISRKIDLVPTAFKLRKNRVVADTFHGVGIVVPYDPVTELGYRPLNLSNTQLKALLSQATTATDSKKRADKLDKLQELITCVQFANDEGDPGMGLELGIDLLCNGNKMFSSNILHLLTVGYDLLDREQYRWIVEEQMSGRRHK